MYFWNVVFIQTVYLPRGITQLGIIVIIFYYSSYYICSYIHMNCVQDLQKSKFKKKYII